VLNHVSLHSVTPHLIVSFNIRIFKLYYLHERQCKFTFLHKMKVEIGFYEVILMQIICIQTERKSNKRTMTVVHPQYIQNLSSRPMHTDISLLTNNHFLNLHLLQIHRAPSNCKYIDFLQPCPYSKYLNPLLLI